MRLREVKRLLVVFRRFDAWATLLLGVLVVLSVVILLSTPGPWRTVTGSNKPPVNVAAPPAANIAVFARGDHGGACTGVLWLHVDHDRPSATVAVVDPSTQGVIAGAGFISLKRALREVGPEAASAALGNALGVRMDGYVVLDREALRLAVQAMTPLTQEQPTLVLRRHALAAWEGHSALQRPWMSQYLSLTMGVPRLPRHELEIVALANYILGFGHVKTDLKLRNVTEIATTVQAAEADRLFVGSLPVLRLRCRGVEVWRPDSTGAAVLGRAARCTATPTVRTKAQSTRVLVVVCGPSGVGDLYRDEVRKKVRRSAGFPVDVSLVNDTSWDRVVVRTERAIAESRPLAVYVAPPEVGAMASAVSAADALKRIAGSLRAAGVPAVFGDALAARNGSATEWAAMSVAIGTTIQESGFPILSSSALLADTTSGRATARTRRICASAGAAMLVRSCWPGVLAPRLPSTRLGFSLARRQRTVVGVVSAAGQTAPPSLARFVPYGYRVVAVESNAHASRKKTIVVYRRGMRTAALSVAGDLGLPVSAVSQDDRAPQPVTLYLAVKKQAGRP